MKVEFKNGDDKKRFLHNSTFILSAGLFFYFSVFIFTISVHLTSIYFLKSKISDAIVASSRGDLIVRSFRRVEEKLQFQSISNFNVSDPSCTDCGPSVKYGNLPYV